jgi:hypothetical protein
MKSLNISDIKKNSKDILSFVAVCMDLEDILLGEISQTMDVVTHL